MVTFHRKYLLTLVTCLVLFLSCFSQSHGNEAVEAKLQALGADLEYDGGDNVISVSFDFEPIATDRDLKLLKELDHLVELNLGEFRFTKVGLKHISSLVKLKRLYLSDTKFTDADLQYLEGLTKLEIVYLRGTAITDAAIPTLAALPNLTNVALGKTRVTAEGIRSLSNAKPELIFDESWDYMASIIDGRGVLDMYRATIIFNDISGAKSFGGGSGSSIDISSHLSDEESSSENHVTKRSYGGGFSFGFRGGGNTISAIASREKGIPTLKVRKHVIEIFKNGTEIVVDGQSFELGVEKARIIVEPDGVAKLEE